MLTSEHFRNAPVPCEQEFDLGRFSQMDDEEAWDADDKPVLVRVALKPRAVRRLQALALEVIAAYEAMATVQDLLESPYFDQGYGDRHPEFIDAVARHGAEYWRGDEVAYIRARWVAELYEVIPKMFRDYVGELIGDFASSQRLDTDSKPVFTVEAQTVDDFIREWGITPREPKQ